MELRDADVVLVGLLLAVGLALAGYALGSVAADAVGHESRASSAGPGWSPASWFSWGDGSIAPPPAPADGGAGSVESG